MNRVTKYFRFAAAIYMALYFLCNAALIHNHFIDGHNISHAHLFKGAQHTADAAELISLFNVAPAESAETVHAPEFTIAWQEELQAAVISADHSRFSDAPALRGPPTAIS